MPSPANAVVPQSSPPPLTGGWSPLGPTPGGPPVRSGNGDSYLPPVAPPSASPAGQTETPPAAPSGGRWGWRAAFSFLAGGLIAAAGFGAAQLGRADDSTADVVETALTTSTTEAPAPTTSIVVDLEDIEEPAALVAVTLGPAVVQIETDVGLGSGVIYGDGLILTNNHVVEGSSQLRVRLSTGETIDGEILGTHEPTDVAVVSVGPGRNLPIAPLATGEKIQVG
ncbi:trypsin-like peptidase domain-containing protein, partial [Okeania sp. SIO2B9]|uniref:trypsin-like peptidase domain-containing protein n=1 Tax=Okeania sp. SIO2B9 TaxID=2607782 RepID=UPI00142A2C8C